MIKSFFTLFVSSFFSIVLSAQTTVAPATINCSGGAASLSYYQYEWSVGESASIQTFESPSLIVTTGLLQPVANNSIVNTANLWASDEIKIFPNPATTQFEVDFFSKQRGKVFMQLIDQTGRIIAKREFDYSGAERIEKWDVSAYINGQYFLSIVLDPQPGSTAKKGGFKIQKIQ